MANFSSNQVRQFYVGDTYSATVTDTSAAKTIGGITTIDEGGKKQVFFYVKGADTVLRSDFIDVASITQVKAIAAADMAYDLRQVEVTLDSDVNSGAPIGGQDYILRIVLPEFFGGVGNDYVKDIAVHATSGMSASDFYLALLDSANKNFSRESGATNTSNPYLSFSVDNTTTATKFIIEEKEQEYALGTKKQKRVRFEVIPTDVYYNADDVTWGVVTEVTSGLTSVGNGKKVANMEWFYAGEKGDQYRYVGWPNYVPTTYLVDASQAYNMFEIHYAFTGTGVNSYRTEKQITIVSSDATALNDFIDEFETATGLTITGV